MNYDIILSMNTALQTEVSSEVQDFLNFIEAECENEYFDIKLMPADRTNRLKFSLNRNYLLVDFYLNVTCFGIETINAGRSGTRIGQDFLEIVKLYVEENDLGLFAEDVHNITFFDRQDFEPSIDDPDNPYGYKAQWFWRG